MFMKTIFVLIDACKNMYVTEKYMPFTYEMSRNGRYISKIYPSPGFCERSEIFTGLDCYESGNFTATGWYPAFSQYKSFKRRLAFYDFLSKFSDRSARFVFRNSKIAKRVSLKSYRIPFRTLSNLILTEDGEERLADCENIFDILDEGGLSYTDQCFTSLTSAADIPLDKLVKAVSDEASKDIYFIPAYIGIADSMGHIYGADVENLKPVLSKIDHVIAEIKNIADQREYALAVLGDHGMVPVHASVNIADAVKAAGYRLHKDYEMFLDSTYVRFWSESKGILAELEQSILEKFDSQGIMLDRNSGIKYRLPVDLSADDGHGIYGDMLWCANPGVIIAPDFFNPLTPPIRGMHGYLKTDDEHGTGIFISAGGGIPRKETQSAQLKDICAELCDILEIRRPDYSKWKRMTCQL